ncbi:radical SAM protein, partial [Dorea formicigenerans]|uniref:radical SAM protein n=1 Tax=Dorea formicigenerans TaxID=39486 RepID=UPI001EDCCF3C
LDPRTVTREAAHDLAALGINRVSLGVQDLDPRVQEAIGRVQPFDVISDAVEALRGVGIDAINFDLMYGLQRQAV